MPNQAPTSFQDPSSYPVSFTPKEPGTIPFGQDSFPVTFAFGRSPRAASILSLAIDQANNILIDRQIYSDIQVLQVPIGGQFTIKLVSDGTSIDTSEMHLEITSTGGSVLLQPGGLAHLRQPSVAQDVSHIFSMSPSTRLFAKAYGLYPTASLDLSFQTVLRDDSSPWGDIEVPDKVDTSVLLSPAGASGIVDILAVLRLRWYVDAARTSLYGGPDPMSRDESYGIRLYITKAGLFKTAVQLLSNGSAVAESMLPSGFLQDAGFDNVDAFYCGGGTLAGDLFFGSASDIEIDSSGLPIQFSALVSKYTLTNELEDIDSSSSSESSLSSVNSSSSQSQSSTSSLSSGSSSSITVSTSSLSTASSESSSSPSSGESASSSSTPSSESSISYTSQSSSASSKSSVMSSLSTSSSLSAAVMAWFHFGDGNDISGFVPDRSESAKDARLALPGVGLGPPTWGRDYGRGAEEGYLFSANSSSSQYIQLSPISHLASLDRGTVAAWIRLDEGGNPMQSVWAFANGFTGSRTEVAMFADWTNDCFRMQCVLDGVTQWSMRSVGGEVSGLAGQWTHLAAGHNGTIGSIWVNGVSVEMAPDVSYDTSVWLSGACAAASPADKFVMGAIPRTYSPLMALGFSGSMSEIKIWSERLSSEDILREYASGIVSSTSSSS